MGDSSFAQREDQGALLRFSGIFQASMSFTFEVFLLENLLTPGSFTSYQVPEDFATHGKVLNGYVPDLKTPFHFWLHYFFPAHKMDLLLTISPSFPQETTKHLIDFIGYRLGS